MTTPSEFRGKKVLRLEDKWHVLRDAEGWTLAVCANCGDIIWRRTGPNPAVFNFMEAHNLALPQYFAEMNSFNQLLIPDIVGVSYHTRREEIGWQNAINEVKGYALFLLNLWPNVAVIDVSIHNIHLVDRQHPIQLDYKTALTGSDVRLRFPLKHDWHMYIKRQIQASWSDFMDEYETAIDLVQEMREENKSSIWIPTPPQRFPWTN